jgi:hypothetical protein
MQVKASPRRWRELSLLPELGCCKIRRFERFMHRYFVTAKIAAAGLLLLSACSTQPQIPPLDVKQAEAGEAITPNPALTLVSGRLGMVADGKSMLPYYIGTHPGCVAGQVGMAILLLPLALFLGHGSYGGGGSCTVAAPALVVVNLESRRGGSLSVTENGLFSAQVPAGTYLVPEIEDNALRIAATMVFQVPTPGQAYYLGDVELSFSGDRDKTRVLSLEIRDDYVAGQAARLATVPPAQAKGEQRALLAPFTPYPGAAYFTGDQETADRKWSAYLDQVVAELAAKGIHLLGVATAATPLSDGAAAHAENERADGLARRGIAEQ